MAQNRRTIRDILKFRNIEIVANRNNTTEDDVGKSLAPLTPLEGLFTPLIKVTFQVFRSAGVKTTKEETRMFDQPYEVIVAAIVMSIQNQRMDLRQMLDTARGGYLEIALPIDALSFGGTVTFVLDDLGEKTQVTGKYEIPGQLNAWGKGTNALNQVWSGINMYVDILTK